MEELRALAKHTATGRSRGGRLERTDHTHLDRRSKETSKPSPAPPGFPVCSDRAFDRKYQAVTNAWPLTVCSVEACAQLEPVCARRRPHCLARADASPCARGGRSGDPGRAGERLCWPWLAQARLNPNPLGIEQPVSWSSGRGR